ncbi:NERD domain-containing protein [Salirhabdus sp. Marseille-P4669]|uniref:NERD domain-containing protein n=1 Tax=Salirhabdus sp. Marseille-P4669 TaxID=2042310 RepID=UPI000C7D0579|nr:NERD domain-containing protein [Salirhabdus sp. Marseille-P4669]
MAQLIKLEDYISRYEQDFFHYPGQFLRMKKESWISLKNKWEKQQYQLLENELQNEDKAESQEAKKKSWKLFSRKKEETNDFFPDVDDVPLLPKNKEDLKQYFLDYLYPFQIKWASSTISQSSFVDKGYQFDPLLKYLLQRFPDTFFVLYFPVFQLKNAVVEGNIIIITPVEILCLSILEESKNTTFIANEGRTWYLEKDDIQKKTISPMISLRRTENIVKSILKKYDISIPTYKVVLAKNNKIEFHSEPFHTNYIDETQYEGWFQRLRKLSSPLKHDQLKAGEALLKHCQTTAVRRPEWEMEEDEDWGKFSQ